MHQEVTIGFCPSTLQAISELAIHLAQEQYKNRPDGGATWDMSVLVCGVLGSLGTAHVTDTHAAPDTPHVTETCSTGHIACC
jgi:hypothetical protein